MNTVATRPVRLPKLSASAQWIPVIALIACALLFQYLSDGSFLSPRNLSNLSRQVCVNLTLAVGMTLVILTSGIDLSVGSVMALAGMAAALTQLQGGMASAGAAGAGLSLVAAVAVGAIFGSVNGLAVSRLKITPFIVTLGMMVICRGLTLIVSGAQAVAPIGDTFAALSSSYLNPTASFWLFVGVALAGISFYFWANRQGRYTLGEALQGAGFTAVGCGIAARIFCGYRGVPTMVFVAAACAAVVWFLLGQTRFGRFVYAIGDNREAAELSGVPVAKTLWVVYVIMGALAGLAGALDVARVNAAVPSAGELGELDAIAAVVIGGTSLMGGAGGVGGTLIGVLLMGVLNNGMSLVGITEHYQKVFKGLVIILAVYLDTRSKRRQ